MSKGRILLKLSGEVLGGSSGAGLELSSLEHFSKLLGGISEAGYELGVVSGGGNIIRGKFSDGLDRSRADQIGMMGTVVNSMALGEVMRVLGYDVCVMSSVRSLARSYDIFEARSLLSSGTIVFVAGGTSNPYFSTDSASALRALELGCDCMVKATKVDGVYDKDPKRFPEARRFESISFDEVLKRGLGVMDLTAITLCRENGLDLRVCSIDSLGAIDRVISGVEGTRVYCS